MRFNKQEKSIIKKMVLIHSLDSTFDKLDKKELNLLKKIVSNMPNGKEMLEEVDKILSGINDEVEESEENERPMEPEYVSVKFNEEQISASKQYTKDVEDIAHVLKNSTSLNDRYRSIALTKLEEAMMFINKAIAHGKES